MASVIFTGALFFRFVIKATHIVEGSGSTGLCRSGLKCLNHTNSSMVERLATRDASSKLVTLTTIYFFFVNLATSMMREMIVALSGGTQL